jgi:hypothetical protein
LRDGKLPAGRFINGDDAYACSEQVVTPYPGKNQSADRDGFNFWQSRVRIEIECAFGLLHARWGVLWRPIQLSTDKVPMMMMVLVKLHNMCIDDQGSHRFNRSDAQFGSESQGRVYSTYVDATSVSGSRRDLQRSSVREALRIALDNNNMRRPAHSTYSYM